MANHLDPPVNTNETNRVLTQSTTPQNQTNFGRDVLYELYRLELQGFESVVQAHIQALNAIENHNSDFVNKWNSRLALIEYWKLMPPPPPHVGDRDCFSTFPNSTATGPHISDLANRVDSSIDSDMHNRAHNPETAGCNCGSPTVGDAPDITSHNMTDKVADPCVGAVLDSRVSDTGHQHSC
ncbi:hypothetical protein N7488_011154 [Penicillium malachiteum]|nr:hypothetical protein N7488_011154 [Penicillium malachiteum]